MRRWVSVRWWAAFGLLLWLSAAVAALPRLPAADNLQEEARTALRGDRVIVLMFSSDHCPYCAVVEEEFLRPMILSGDYDDRVIFRHIRVDSLSDVVDFDGAEVSADLLRSRYSVTVTPTIVFLDARGQPLARNLVGVTTRDYYGGYLDGRIDQAVDHLRDPRTLAVVRAEAERLIN